MSAVPSDGEEPWRGWLLASSAGLVAWLGILKEYPRPIVDALFEKDTRDIMFGHRAINPPSAD